MNETIEQPGTETQTAEAPPELSVAEHAAQFSKAALQEAANETPEETEARIHHSAEQRREKETGKFEPGKVRHRAKSAQAGPEDVPRIQALTAKLRAAEEEVTRLKATHAPVQQVARAEARVEQARPEPSRPTSAQDDDPEPVETDPRFAGDYGKYLVAQARWAARDENRSLQRKATEAQTKAKQEEASQAILKGFAERAQAAKTKYPDFDQVAFAPTRIPAGSAIDAFIMEDDSGAEILYHLQSHPEELDSLLGMPVLAQVKSLALLSQRLLSPTPAQAGMTRSAAGGSKVVIPPKPPNLVRTEAQRASEGPPPTDGTLSIAEHAKAFGRR